MDDPNVTRLQNWGDAPFVTVMVAMHNGDAHFTQRWFDSLMAQKLDHKQIQVLVAFDGKPNAKAEAHLTVLDKYGDFQSAFLVASGRHTGYYTMPRNQAFNHPYNFGLYMVHMDADNEFMPDHLSGLLDAIRTPDPEDGWAHFVYSRREYVKDPGFKGEALTGSSPLVQWNRENVALLAKSSMGNFIDTGDFMVSRGALYELAERTGCVWNAECRRFGDWELVCRMAKSGFRGRAIDQVTHRYHWTGSNLQLTRAAQNVVALPQSVYDEMVARGEIIDVDDDSVVH